MNQGPTKVKEHSKKEKPNIDKQTNRTFVTELEQHLLKH